MTTARARMRQAESRQRRIARPVRRNGADRAQGSRAGAGAYPCRRARPQRGACPSGAGERTEAARLSKLRFDYGADSFLLLIEAERDRADARAALAQSDAAVSDAQISLFKALGGHWQGPPAPLLI